MIRNCENLPTSIKGKSINEWNIGVDMVEIARFQQLKYSSNKQFYKRVFTPEEIRYCLSFNSPAPHFAANFAGKEAVYKALNMFCDINIHKIEILRNDKGSPVVKLHLSPEENAGRLQVKVSLSHSLSHAIAFAVACRPIKSKNSNRKVDARSQHGR
jgi:holo-[acyl-carrier protein] synthase